MRRALVPCGLLLTALMMWLGAKVPYADQRLANCYRRAEQNGWTFVHLEGSPSDIGYQHGVLLAGEIEDGFKVQQLELTHDGKKDWNFYRKAAKEVLWPHIEQQYREEMQGISDGLNARGIKHDIWDIVALNAAEEWSYYVKWYDQQHGKPNAKAAAPDHCSAFVATGSYTKDGRPMIAHNNWSNYLDGERWTIIFDVVPKQGHRFLMDGYPGLIHSADDFGINDAGIAITETTIGGFSGWDSNGVPEFVRARRAMQYSTSIDEFASTMKDGNNGGYANDWLLVDVKNNEIAHLELGLKNVTLERTKDGYFVGANFPKNPKLMKEETNFNPADKTTSGYARQVRWEQLMTEYKGKIDVAAAQGFLADRYDAVEKKSQPSEHTLDGEIDKSPRGMLDWQTPFAPAGAVQNKVADAAMIQHLTLSAHAGHANGDDFHAAEHLKNHPEFAWQKPLLRDMKSQPWTTFEAIRMPPPTPSQTPRARTGQVNVSNEFCDVSLPVPLDQTFTYALPLTLRHRAKVGSRLLVPFGARKLTGVILALHDDPPEHAAREALRLLDEQPVLDEPLIALGRWISGYYCSPLGDVFRSMLPLAAEIRAGKVYSLTDSGRDAARQLLLEASADDVAGQILALLERRSISASYLKTKFPLAGNTVRALEKKGFIAAEDTQTDRDPMRAPSADLRVEAIAHEQPPKLPKAERELLAFLDLHPGSHNLEQLESTVKNASQAARSLGRKNLIAITREPLSVLGMVDRPPHRLNPAQQVAVDAVREAIEAHVFRTFLIQGVTGSGKTEVYLTAIDAALAAGRSALLLVPEIALTPAVAGQFFSRFGQRVAILHSAFSDAERAEQWRRISTGKAEVVVGTRSGVFAPIRNLGLIIIDEEHDGSYKQEENPRYNGRDTAIVRAQHADACVVLGSATPSLESRYNAERGKYTLLLLPDRIQQRPMPRVDLIDMRQEFLETRKQSTFSRALVEAVTERLQSGEQTMILLNRRGYSSFIACRACGYRIECVNCSITLTFHRRDRRLLCHMCNYACKVPETCPQCESEHIYFLGTGSERVEDELHTLFPDARIARLDRDTVTGKKHYEQILQGFREKSFDLLVGTQMIAKGHDIPNVTLVGVVSADVGLGMPDFRAAERTFQLLTQVAGRAGRGDLPGIVLVQTINPDHYAVRMAAAHDYESFYEKELQFRRMMHYPPFTAMANLLVRAAKQEDALRMSTELDFYLKPAPADIKIMGPAEAPVLRIKAEFRYQFLVKALSRKTLNALLRRARDFALAQKWGATALVIDVDPLTLT